MLKKDDLPTSLLVSLSLWTMQFKCAEMTDSDNVDEVKPIKETVPR